MTETQQVVLFAIAAGAGILLGVAGSLWIDVLVKRSRVLVFAWLDREQSEQARLSVYVKNESISPVQIDEAGALAKGGRRLNSDSEGANPLNSGLVPTRLPLVLEPSDVAVVCVLNIEGSDAINDIAACYVIRSGGKLIKGPVFRHGHAAA
jgi:hypothetical protein